MKKFFSAILLMTMMVFSVGTFVSCNDLVNEIEDVKGQATELEAAVDALEAEIATLETALQNAKAEAADAAAKAKAAADEAQKTGDAAAKAAKDAAAAAAAAQASADALEAQLAEAQKTLQAALDGKADKADVEAAVKEIEALKAALEGKADKTDVEALKKQIEVIEEALKNFDTLLNDLKLKDAELAEAISYNLEAITNLKGQLDAQDMRVEDLETAVAKLVADVKTVNEGLVAIYDILGALANQIQSITFVPEFDKDVFYAQRYNVGTSTTNFVAAATFEVRPAKLASSITSENICFTSVDVQTKAASEAERFAAQVLNADPNTGRVDVVAIITDKDGADKSASDYDHLVAGKKLRLALNVASVDVTELLIADSEPVEIEMVSSEYVVVEKAADVALPIGYPNKKDGKVESTYTASYEMPWNTAVEQSVKTLFDTDINVLVGGRFLTVAEANALLGMGLNVATKVTTVYDGAEEKKVYPVKVNGTDINATATLVASADYPGDKAVGKKSVSTLAVTVTDAAKKTVATLSGTATYTVTNKKADFGFAAVNEAWKYTYGKSMTVKGRELAVTGYEKFTEGQNLGTFTATWGKDGKATTTVTALSSKAVKFTDVVLPFTPGKETTYTFKGQVIDGTTTYSVAFDVVLGAMPENKTIDLGTFSIYGDAAAAQNVAVSPVTKAIAEIKAYDSSITLEAAYDRFVESCAVSGVKGDGVTLNGKADASAASLTILTAPNEKNNQVRDEKSYVRIAPVVNYENAIVVTKTYEFCGVQYTFVATVNTSKPTISFATNEVFVENSIAAVDGTVALPLNKTAANITTGTSTPYALNSIDLRNYIKVQMPQGISEAGYRLRYTLLTPMVDKDGKALYPATPSVQEEITYVDVARSGAGAMPLNWNVDLNELEYEIALISSAARIDRNGDKKINAADDIVFEKVNVKLQVPALVTFAAANEVKAKYVNGVQTKANIAGAISVVDKFGNAVYNPYAADLYHIFSGYYATLDAKGNVLGAASNEDTFFNVYDMAVTAADLKDVKVYLNGAAIDQTQIKFDYNKNSGEIVMSEENANLTGDIKFEVPVTLTYIYDNYGKLAQKGTAVVVFSKNGTDVEDTTTPDVSMPSPAAKQWILPAEFYQALYDEPSANVRSVLDLGVVYTDYTQYGFEEDTAFIGLNMIDSGMTADDIKEYFNGIEWMTLPGGVQKFVVRPTNSTSGVIELYSTMSLNPEPQVIAYSELTDKTCKFDVSEFVNKDLVVTGTVPASTVKILAQ